MSSPAPKPPFQIGFTEFIILMSLYMSLTALSIDTVLPALALIGEDLHANHNQTQYVIGALLLGLTVGQIFYGTLADSFGRKPVIYAGLGIFVAGNLLSYAATSFDSMLLGRLLQGAGVASTRIISTAIVRDRYQGREMARVMSFIMSLFIIMPIFAPALGTLILAVAHWQWIFLLFIAAALVLAGWTTLRLPETLQASDKRPFRLRSISQAFATVVRTPITLGYTACAGLIFAPLVGYISSARQIFQDYFSAGNRFALYFAISALFLGVASLLNSQIVRRYGMRVVAHYGLLGVMLTSSAFGLFLLALPQFISVESFLLFLCTTFFFMGLLFGNFNTLAMEPMGHMAGTASSVIGCLTSSISLSLGTLIGQAYDDSLLPLCLGFWLSAAIAFMLQYYLNQRYKEVSA